MNQCFRIILTMNVPRNFLHTFVQKHAKELNLEGTVQLIGQNINIIICGTKDSLDEFVDIIHQQSNKNTIENIAIEPFLKEKDYRGVFRVIE